MVRVEPVIIDSELNETNTTEMEKGKEWIHLAPLDPEQLIKLRERLRGLIPPEPKVVRITPLLNAFDRCTRSRTY